MKIEKPKLTGKTDRENLQILESWANSLVDELQHQMTHIDETNMVGDMITRKEIETAMERQYMELRELIIQRTKGG